MDAIEIDFRPFIRALAASWRMIVLVALLAAGIAGLLSALRPLSYTADAQVAIVQQVSQVNLKSNVTDQPNQVDQADPNRLQTSLLTLADNGSVAQDVITTLGDSLSPALRKTQALRSVVKVEAKGNTNVLQVHVITGREEEAKAIASAWSSAFVKLANTALAKHGNGTALLPELEQARINYAAKQQQLSDSTLQQDVLRLRRQTESLNSALSSLRLAHLNVITSTLATQSKNEAAFLDLSMGSVFTAQTLPAQAERTSQIAKLSGLYSTTTRLTRLRDDVLALRDQVSKGSTSGTGLGYTLLKAQLFAGSGALPTSLQVQTAANDIPTQADLDALLATTEAHLKNTQDQISALVASFRQGTAYQIPSSKDLEQMRASFQNKSQGAAAQQATPSLLYDMVASQINGLVDDPKINQLEATYQKLAGELGQKEQQLYVLTQERDLAKENYTALTTRSTELQIASANDDAVVRVVGQGAVSGVSRGTARSVGLAFGIGLLVATLFVLLRALLSNVLREPSTVVGQRVVTE